MLKIIKFLKGKNRVFEKNTFSEKTENISNPCRGWYNVIHLDITQDFSVGTILIDTNSDDCLVLILINISKKNGEPLDEKDEDKIVSLLKGMRDAGKNVILRIAYDNEGKAMESEPTFFSQIRQHAENVGKILKKCSDEVFVYQGMLIGKWGEMHSSRFTVPEKLREIYHVLEKYWTEGQYFAVRCPYQWRSINQNKQPAIEKKMGLFDDAIFGSESDMGTFGNMPKSNAGWNCAWTRAEELEFENVLCANVPNGGEVLYNEEFQLNRSAKDCVDDLMNMHITYLNRAYDPRILDRWKQNPWNEKGPWDGKSVFDYIGSHLGYRFFISDVVCEELNTGYELQITMENQGFANAYREMVGNIYIDDGNGPMKEIAVDYDFRKINAGDKAVLVTKLPDEFKINADVYFILKQKCDDKTISFANNECMKDGRVLLGKLCFN